MRTASRRHNWWKTYSLILTAVTAVTAALLVYPPLVSEAAALGRVALEAKVEIMGLLLAIVTAVIHRSGRR